MKYRNENIIKKVDGYLKCFLHTRILVTPSLKHVLA